MATPKTNRSSLSLPSDEIMLGVLSAVDRNSDISQRTISREINVALGLANGLLKRCVRKGWIKIKQAPRRRYSYYLTPQGFAEKARLTGQYLSASFNFFRRAREQMSELMDECASSGRGRIAFAGVSDIAEVGRLCVHDHPVTLVGIVDASHNGDAFLGVPVRPSLAKLGPVDALIVTDLIDAEAVFKAMEAELGQGRVLAPRLLRLPLATDVARGSSDRAAE